MKTTLSFLTVLFLSNFVIAQTTAIPDANFEQALINMGLDTGTPDGTVLTANINTLGVLNLFNQNITDLTGLQDFTALHNLNCGSNSITTIDISQNQNLTVLICSINQITSLDVSQNPALTSIQVTSNQLTGIDVSQNINLISLFVDNNLLTQLDLSQNTVLTALFADNNQLNCLNIKNGNNSNIPNLNFDVSSNSGLSCIEVDDVNYSTTNWLQIDAGVSYNIDCGASCTVGVEEHNFSNLLFYPNPTEKNISIDLGKSFNNISTTITNSLGKVIQTNQFRSTDIINVDINAPTGMYFIHIETSNGETKTIKVIKKITL